MLSTLNNTPAAGRQNVDSETLDSILPGNSKKLQELWDESEHQCIEMIQLKRYGVSSFLNRRLLDEKIQWYWLHSSRNAFNSTEIIPTNANGGKLSGRLVQLQKETRPWNRTQTELQWTIPESVKIWNRTFTSIHTIS